MALYAGLLAPPMMQDALRQPEKWNSDWEKITLTVERVSPSDLVHSAAMQLAMAPDSLDSSLLEYQGLLGALCSVQVWLTQEALLYFARNDLEAKWMGASAELRGKHILIGLSNACSIAKNLHDARVYCGRELRLSRLRGEGRVLLDLLKAVMTEDILKVPEKPKYVPHPGWDAISDAQSRSAPSDVEKLTLGNILVLRNKLICHIIHFTIRSFLGLELPKITVKKHRKKNIAETFPSQAVSKDIMEKLLGHDGARAAAKDNKDAWKDRKSKRKECCSYTGCGKANDGDANFPRCKKCWDGMQREVVYCSVDCQRADWKLHHKGICGKALNFDAVSKPVPPPPPRACSYSECATVNGPGQFPRCKKCWDEMTREVLYCSVQCQNADWPLHKLICGKPLNLDTLSRGMAAPAPDTPAAPPTPAPVIGPPVGGYKRTPSLMYQIAGLNHLPKIDYIVMVSSDDSINIDFPDPEAQSLFRKCREKAVTTGDRQSVATMAHFLCWMTVDSQNFIEKGATSNAIVCQLKKEYAFDELHLAVKEMQRRQNLDPFKRPPLLFTMSPQNWAQFFRGMNFKRQVVLD
ncbi:hypothetical protein DFH09DRAFT_1151945 [Mycena vulgaris]|nr:hypothetical protein DFH09DRAFT_1151945 [Mycena vulgaris]